MNFAALLDLEKTPAALPYDARAYDLEGFREWLNDLGCPHQGQWFVHIAGTKGKGSTAALTEALLLALGYDTATFTSPHLAHFGERYRINGVAWTPDEFEAALERLNTASPPPWRDALKSAHRFRTAFEFMTMAALVEFAQRQRRLQEQTPPRRQIVCWETGLGGRLDCTNVVDPVVSVITTLGLDHTAILGDTIEAIAAEKAGIIKPQRPVVVARQTPGFADRVLPVLRRRAAEVNAPLFYAWETCPVVHAQETAAGQAVIFQLPDGSRHSALLPLHGAFQRSNLEAALTAACLVRQHDIVSSSSKADGAALSLGTGLGPTLAQGVAACRWPGRFDVQRAPSGQILVLDGAHCPLSAAALGKALEEWRVAACNDGSWDILWGMQRDKQHQEFLAALLDSTRPGAFGCVRTYRVTGVRGAEAETLAAAAAGLGISAQAHASPQEALAGAMRTGRNVLAVGTLYTLAELRQCWAELHSPQQGHNCGT